MPSELCKAFRGTSTASVRKALNHSFWSYSYQTQDQIDLMNSVFEEIRKHERAINAKFYRFLSAGEVPAQYFCPKPLAYWDPAPPDVNASVRMPVCYTEDVGNVAINTYTGTWVFRCAFRKEV